MHPAWKITWEAGWTITVPGGSRHAGVPYHSEAETRWHHFPDNILKHKKDNSIANTRVGVNSIPELELQLNSNSNSGIGIGIEIGGIENGIGIENPGIGIGIGIENRNWFF